MRHVKGVQQAGLLGRQQARAEGYEIQVAHRLLDDRGGALAGRLIGPSALQDRCGKDTPLRARHLLDYGMHARIVPGADSGVASLAFGHVDYELQLLVEVGFTPAEAFIAATRTTAEAIGMAHEMGTIEVGKAADFVAFEGDPTTDVRAVSRVAAVFAGGNRVV